MPVTTCSIARRWPDPDVTFVTPVTVTPVELTAQLAPMAAANALAWAVPNVAVL